MTQVSSAQFKTLTATLYADNTAGEIGANDLRTQMNNIADSAVFKTTGKTANPTASDDVNNTSGNGAFQIGDIWVNETTNRAYMCMDSSTGTAIWTEVTYTDPGALSATAAPAPQEIAVWVNGTTLKGFPELKWDDVDGELELQGDLVVTGTVDGRDIAADGAKLDGIPASAISQITAVNVNVGGGSLSYGVTTLQVATGDGLELSNPSAGVARLEIRNNDITVDTANRTLGSSDNFAFVTNTGASGTVRWTLPITSVLQSTPRLVAIFFKSANQTMEIIGANTVTVNGATESGSEETLIEICPTAYNSFAYVFYGGASNRYFVVQGSDINKPTTTADNQIAVWSGDGILEGDAGFTWGDSILDVDGEIKGLLTFNAQVGASYTLVLTDRSRVVTMNNASPNTVLIPADADLEFPIGTFIRVIQIGAGTTSIDADVGVTLNGVSGGIGAISARWDEVRLYKAAADTWYVTGDIGTVA
jgi:hypothetical protein